jgi:hypothetical protein
LNNAVNCPFRINFFIVGLAGRKRRSESRFYLNLALKSGNIFGRFIGQKAAGNSSGNPFLFFGMTLNIHEDQMTIHKR